jgi:acetate kinase
MAYSLEAGNMSDALLVLNAGSSSLKFSVFLDEEPPQLLVHGQLEGLRERRRKKGAKHAGTDCAAS